MSSISYQFTNDWFETGARNVWDAVINKINPSTILEIGSYEGASACYLIEKLGARKEIELHCIDTWEGGIEHGADGDHQSDMVQVRNRFDHNIQLARSKVNHNVEVVIRTGSSDRELSKLLAAGKQNYFDFIYVDGSHQAPDVLTDAILSFKLLKLNGVIAFDDYLWQENLQHGVDPIRCPKIAIDAFTNIFCRKIKVMSAPLYQIYVQKISA